MLDSLTLGPGRLTSPIATAQGGYQYKGGNPHGDEDGDVDGQVICSDNGNTNLHDFVVIASISLIAMICMTRSSA